MSDRMPHGPEIEEILVTKMRSDLSRRPWYSRWYGRLGITGAALVALASGGVAALTLLSPEHITDSFVVHCLSEANVNSDGTLPGAAATVSSPNGVLPIDDAVAMCEQMWEAGALTNSDPLEPDPKPGEAPSAFTTCVTDNGEAAVVPGRIECSVLRLHPYQPNVPEGR